MYARHLPFRILLVILLSLSLLAVNIINKPTLAITSADHAPLIGSMFTISNQTINEGAPALDYDNLHKEFLVVWYNDRLVDDDIYAQRISTTGSFLSWFSVTHGLSGSKDRAYPAIAYNPHHGDHLVVYSRYDPILGAVDIVGRRVNIFGPQGNEFTIASSIASYIGIEERPRVVHNSQQDEYLVVWVKQAAYKQVFAQRVAGVAGGGSGGSELIGTNHLLVSRSNGDCTSPDIAYHTARNEYVLVYNYYRSGIGTELEARRLDANGEYIPGAQFTINTEGENASLAINPHADQVVIMYEFTGGAGPKEVWRFRTDGEFSGIINGPFIQNPANDVLTPVISRMGDTNLYQVVWAEQHNGRGVRGMRFNTNWESSHPFDINMAIGDYENLPAVVGAPSTALTVWEHDSDLTASYDITGQLLGYRVNLPLVLRMLP